MSWQAFLQSDNGRILVLVFFMAIIGVSVLLKMLALIFRSTTYNPSDNKILGGLAVLMVALIANNGWIYFLSFFIAGLLIASERFMLLLAAVFNSDSPNVHKIPSYWHEEEKLYDAQELVEIVENSAEETDSENETKSKKMSSTKSAKTKTEDTDEQKKERFKQYVQKISDIESRVMRVLKQRTSYKYLLKGNVVVKVGAVAMKYDAIYVEPETNQIKGAFEIKYFPTMKLMNVRAYLGNRAKRYLSDEFKVGFMLVFSNYDHDELDKILEVVAEFEKTHDEAFVAIYQNEDHSLSALYETSLKKAFPTSLELLDF